MTIMDELKKYGSAAGAYPGNGSIVDALNDLAVQKGGHPVAGTIKDAISNLRNAIDLGGSGSDAPKAGAKFIDYDGTVLHYLSRVEALDLKSLPANPRHEGLTAQGWNWSLESIKSYLKKYPDATITVGQMYITDDGKTRIYLDVRTRLTIPLTFYQSISEAVTLNWGDGSDEETVSGTGTVTTSHTYSEEGKYLLTFEVTDDDCQLNFGDSSTPSTAVFGSGNTGKYANVITAIHFGKNVTSLDSSAFNGACLSLSNIIFPRGFQEFGRWSAFGNIDNVTGIVIPDSMESLYASSVTMASFIFGNAHNLREISYPAEMTGFFSTVSNSHYLRTLSIPEGVDTIVSGSAVGCEKLEKLTIPDTVTTISSPAISYCYDLRELNIPNSVTSIGNGAFENCPSLESITIPESITSLGTMNFGGGISNVKEIIIQASVSSIPNQAFSKCDNCKTITITGDITSIGNEVFDYCGQLTEVTLPSSLTTIGKMAFRGCVKLTELTIPENVTSIDEQAFYNCTALHDLYVEPTSPPTLGYTTVGQQTRLTSFYSLPSDCVIHVPAGTGDTYKAATGWSEFASQIVETSAEG